MPDLNMTTRSAAVLEMLRDAASRARGVGRWRRTACPLCGAGKRGDDALGVRDDGLVKCHRCGVTAHLDGTPEQSSEQAEADDIERRREWALRLIETGTAIEAGDPVDRYLRGRGLRPLASSWPADLQRVTSKHRDGGWYPCMLGVVRDATGRVIGCHRTFLDDDGRKANVRPVRLSLGTLRGGAVRLGPFNPTILVGEGIETAIAASMLTDEPATPWACLSAGGLAMLDVPVTTTRVIAALDFDDAGILAAKRLLKRLGRLGIRDVRCIRPNEPGDDFNDVLNRGNQ